MGASSLISLSQSFYVYLYSYMCMYICVCIYISPTGFVSLKKSDTIGNNFLEMWRLISGQDNGKDDTPSLPFLSLSGKTHLRLKMFILNTLVPPQKNYLEFVPTSKHAISSAANTRQVCSNSILTPPAWKWHQIPQDEGSVPKSDTPHHHHHFQCQLQVPGCLPVLLTG